MDFAFKQLHLSPVEPSDIKVSWISNILLTVMFCTALKPNGKFSGNFFWLDMSLTKSERESNTLSGSVFIKVGSLLSGYLYLFHALNSAHLGKKQLES